VKPHRIVSLLALGSALLAAPSLAHAQPVPPDRAAIATTLWEQAKDLMRVGKFKEAALKLEESVRLDPMAVGAMVALAECYEKDSRLASAWTTYLLAEAEARKQNDPRGEWPRERAAELRPRRSTLEISAPSSYTEASGAVIYRDGVKIGPAEWNSAMPIDGGEHTVRLEAPGKVPYDARVTVLFERDAAKVALPELATLQDVPPAVVPDPPKQVAPPILAPAVPPVEQPAPRGPAVWAWVTGATGLVAIAVGAGLRIDAYLVETDQADRCGPARDACPSDYDVEGTNAQKKREFGAFVGLTIGGGVLVGVGAVGLIVNAVRPQPSQNGKSATSITAVAPWTDGRTSAGLAASGRF